jgi:thiol-disulfide isomerase/thioredoxin
LRSVPRALAALLAPLLLVGCGGSSFSAGEQGFVSGDGQVTVRDPADREEPKGEVAGETVDGEPVSLADHAGKVVVIPVWGSWCAPCRKEAPMLAEAARGLADDGVVFLGIDSRDPDAAAVRRFLERFDIPYDSIYDPDGTTLLAFHGTLPPCPAHDERIRAPEPRTRRVRGRGDRAGTTTKGLARHPVPHPSYTWPPGPAHTGRGQLPGDCFMAGVGRWSARRPRRVAAGAGGSARMPIALSVGPWGCSP